MEKIRFGVLGTSRIAAGTVIPAMQQGRSLEVAAIASRDPAKAQRAADRLGIPKAYGAYEQLLADPGLDAIYIPLPNHMHVPWAIRCLEAGKHVLCEKPVGCSAEEAGKLLAAARNHPQLKVMEAFMYRHHPRWQKTVELINTGVIGEVKAIQSFFSYYNDDARNIRNDARMGGGGLMDIGCYCISLSRLLFGREPVAVTGIMHNDPDFKVDRLVSGVLDFSTGTSIFTCSTQCYRDQHVKIVGSRGKIEMEMPFRPPIHESTKLLVSGEDAEQQLLFDPCNQFTLQGESFARSILEDTPVAVPLEDSLRNMKVIDRLRSRK